MQTLYPAPVTKRATFRGASHTPAGKPRPWRKRVGIEPTIPGTNPESTDLKSAEAARPHALPKERTGQLPEERRTLVELTGIEPVTS